MREVFTAYMDGRTLDEVMAATGASRGRCRLPERNRTRNGLSDRARQTPGAEYRRVAERAGNGKRRASVHDFHSFRVTWITLALAAGVPLELVQRVTGHRTVEVVMKHYFPAVGAGTAGFPAGVF
jgi:integrase